MYFQSLLDHEISLKVYNSSYSLYNHDSCINISSMHIMNNDILTSRRNDLLNVVYVLMVGWTISTLQKHSTIAASCH